MKLKSIALVTTAICTASPLLALGVTPSADAFGLGNTLFLNQPSIILNSASYSGSFGQAGTYSNFSGTYGMPNQGIVLSSGNVSDYAAGANTEEGMSTSFNATANASEQSLLGPITGQDSHFDVVSLDLGFFVNSNINNVTFFATFGSEEWPEFVGEFQDGFGLYVNGTNVASATPTGGGTPLAINIDHPDMRDISGTELDGVLAPGGNPILRFDVPVNPGQQNEMVVILGDANDSQLDTTIYLSSFFSEDAVGGFPGQSEFDPLLPSNPPDPVTGEFIIDLPPGLEPEQTIWIDPPVSVGYTYSVDNGAEFDTVTAPSLATVADLDGYTITDGVTTVALAPGATLDLVGAFGSALSTFTLAGIDTSLMLDPANPLAFPLGVSLTSVLTTGAQVSVTPITQNVGTAPIPLPAAGFLYAFGLLAGAGVMRRRQNRI